MKKKKVSKRDVKKKYRLFSIKYMHVLKLSAFLRRKENNIDLSVIHKHID